MITEKDLQEAIAECEGQKNPNSNTCIKLAAFYTIRDNLFPTNSDITEPPVVYSRSSASEDFYSYNSGSEFSDIIKGMETNKVISIMDELMDTLQVINPRLYNSVIRKLLD